MKRPLVDCSFCRGQGARPLSPPLYRCLQAIRALGTPTVPEIAGSLKEDVHPTAINRRVKALMGLHLVHSVRNGCGVVRYRVNNANLVG